MGKIKAAGGGIYSRGSRVPKNKGARKQVESGNREESHMTGAWSP